MNASVGAHPPGQHGSGWAWPIDVARYDRAAGLSAAEREHMGRLVARFAAGGRGWHVAARPALERLLRPLHDTLDHLGATTTEKRNNTVRTTVICLLIRAMHRHSCSFWAFSPESWHEMLGEDYYAYVRQHGVTANARQQLIAVAYLLCGFDGLHALGRLGHHALAKKVFGADLVDAAIADMTGDLHGWGTPAVATWSGCGPRWPRPCWCTAVRAWRTSRAISCSGCTARRTPRSPAAVSSSCRTHWCAGGSSRSPLGATGMPDARIALTIGLPPKACRTNGGTGASVGSPPPPYSRPAG